MVELDVEWLIRWREAMVELVASAMATFEATMGYPPGDNVVGSPLTASRLATIEEMGKALPSDLVTFSRVIGEVRLPDIGNGWFVLNPLVRSRIGHPYNVDVLLFASDGGGTTYAVPIGENGPVLRLREAAEIAPGVYDGERVVLSTPHLHAFLSGLCDAVGLFARAGKIGGL